MKPMRDDRGRRDPQGYSLRVSVEAVADELACAAGLVCGKLNRTPACIVRDIVTRLDAVARATFCALRGAICFARLPLHL